MNSRISKGPLFKFDSHTVIPLFITARKYWDPLVRRRAILLLFKYPRKEGFAIVYILGELCEWAVKVEKEHLDENERLSI